jgi:signal transduction histidine kinase
VLEKVFEPFYTTRAHGTGLGLNIAKRIIEAHGGEIRVSSGETDGTRFEIALPPVNPV